MTNTKFSWDQRNEFIAAALTAGGSSDVQASFCDAALDARRNLGRYARQYMYQTPGGWGDLGSDVLVAFHAWTRSGVLTLDRVPFGTLELANAAYALLASAGCACNDASSLESAARKAALAKHATSARLVMFVNLTPHALHIHGCTSPDGSTGQVLTIEPTKPEARAEVVTTPVEPVAGVPICSVTYGAPVGLAAARPGTYLIVSTLTAQAAVAQGRDVSDLLTPGRPVRDERGVQIGCVGLQRVGK